MYSAERALFELRQGRPIWVRDDTEPDMNISSIIAPVETLNEFYLDGLRKISDSNLNLILTESRAKALGVTLNNKETRNTESAISIEMADDFDIKTLMRLSVGINQSEGLSTTPVYRSESATLSLLRLLRFIPATISVRITQNCQNSAGLFIETHDILSTAVTEIKELTNTTHSSVTRISEANVPLKGLATAQFILFRENNTLLEHLAVLIGEPTHWDGPVPIRIHSACLTGDLFNSLKCDCGEQLHRSLDYFTEQGGGVFLYLNQEGRGIGLGNKLRAYQLQDLGLDTVDADCALGFRPDERDYGVGMKMLGQLGVNRIQILTNNPDKIAWAEKSGLEVVSRIPLYGAPNIYNLPYVKAKIEKAGHFLEEMLEEHPENRTSPVSDQST